MGELLLFIVVALTVAAIVFGVTVMVSGGDPGLTPVEPDGRALALPSDRPLSEEDIVGTRFDTVLRGYRMSQVDQALQRAAYDIGYKGELISVLEAEVLALREGRTDDADVLRRAREAAAQPATAPPVDQRPAADGDDDGPVVSAIPFDPTALDPAAPTAYDPAAYEAAGPAARELSTPADPAAPVDEPSSGTTGLAAGAEPSAVGHPAPRGAQAPDEARAERR